MTTRPTPTPPGRTKTVTEPRPTVEHLTFVTPASHEPVAAPRDHPPAVGRHRDPVGELVHTAVSHRPLEEVVRLVTLLEASPEYAQTVIEVLQAAAVDRPVEDFARLVAELTRPPRDADSADETIRAVIESHVEVVTRLMALHRAHLQPHCGAESVRAAATGRPVEELVELIGRLVEERGREPGGAARQPLSTAAPYQETTIGGGISPGQAAQPGVAAALGGGMAARIRTRRRSSKGTTGDQPEPPLFWPSWLAAAALLVCAAACFPLHRDGASFGVYAVGLGGSAVCVVPALLVAFRPSTGRLAAGALIPAFLAGAVLLVEQVRSTRLSRVVDLMLAPPWSAGLTAVCASLASLAALLLLLMAQMADRRPAPGPTAETRGT